MYEIDLSSFTIKRGEIEQEFTVEDYNFENELFLDDYINFLSSEVVIQISMIIYHNRDVKHLEINLKSYSVKRD